MDRVKAALGVVVAGAAGVIFAPLWVKAAIVAVFLTVIAVIAAARAHDMTVTQTAALYGGKLVVTVVKAVAVVLVEWPLRCLHRVWVRFDVAMLVELAVARATHRAVDHTSRFAGWVRDSRPRRASVQALATMPAGQKAAGSARVGSAS